MGISCYSWRRRKGMGKTGKWRVEVEVEAGSELEAKTRVH